MWGVETLASDLPIELIVVAVPVVIGALLIGHIIGRSGTGKHREEAARLGERLRRAESTCKEHERTLARMRTEHDPVANLALTLPAVVRDMNRNDADPSDVPRLIFQLANAIFKPRQLLLYGVASNKDPRGTQRMLQLIHHQGLEPVPAALKSIPFGHGKIGWTADHELDMLVEDWEGMSRNERVDVADNDPGLTAEIIGPLVQHSKNGQKLLGVLCLGAPKIRPRDPKLMFQLVTNFGSLALVNSSNMKTLRTMANHDGLTNLLNKRCFIRDQAANMLVACERRAQPLSVFIFDIDHFKNYNDTNGHPAGDQLLREMAKLIKEQIRPGDLACRYGGEEFVVAMPETDREEAFVLAQRLREAVAATPFEHREKQPLGMVSISGGIASFPKDGSAIGELIQRADEALYNSKKGGRNRVALYKGVQIGAADEEADLSVVGAAPSEPATGRELR